MTLQKYLKGLLTASLAALLLTSVTPAFAATKIMPLGDSITGSPGCWRAYLWEKLTLNNFTNIDMVGTLPAQGCAVAHDGDNEGHGGILALNMANQSQLPPWLSATKPDVVLMHLGTNDVWSSKPTSEILAAFTTLVQQIRASNTAIKIVVAKIIPMDSARSCGSCADGVIALNNALPAWAAGLSTSASPVTIADIWTGFSAISDTYDGVHPTDAGHKKIADAWYPAVVAALNGASSSSAASSSKLSSSSKSSAVSSPVSSVAANSSSTAACADSCNWYGQSTFPLCVTATSGFNFENGTTCVARSTCLIQAPGYGGIIPGTCGQSSSSIKSSSSSVASSRAPSSSSLSSTYSLSSSSTPLSSSSKSSSSSTPSSSSASSSSLASGSKCTYVISNEWNTGFTGLIRITNKGSTAINGWTVTWSYSDGTKLTGSWNATVTGANPYSATNLSWNANIQPGQSVELGVQGNKGTSPTAQIPVISGSVCN